MKPEYNFNKATKVLWLIFGIMIPIGGRHAYNSGNFEWLAFFLIGAPLWAFINIIIWSHKITLTNDGILISQKFRSPKDYRWDEIEEVKDDYFLIFHLYWVFTSDREIKLYGWKGLAFDNQSTSRYALLLANIITHVKPQTTASFSILKHLNMTNEDIGKHYKSDHWIGTIKVNSYWAEKLN